MADRKPGKPVRSPRAGEPRDASVQGENADVELELLIAEATDGYMEAIERGDAPSVADFAARYPQVRDVLLQVLPALSSLKPNAPSNVVSQASSASSATQDSFLVTGDDDKRVSDVPREHLGDFRIRRVLGRGGMGVVYEAEQRSLGRTVALKVLPFAAMLDERHRNRFRNEARAAATLNHPNIVPIHYVGIERGVHFFAMQLIEGETLAEILRQIRTHHGSEPARPDLDANCDTSHPKEEHDSTQPGNDTLPIAQLSTQWSHGDKSYFRSVAELGVQAARAIDHAHAQGVLHRDIKPGNLMVDHQGKLWVTDFGLARIDSGGVSLTASGDIVGTLRYMSPEQALGQRGIVDQRSDIYSLGATLYEALTLEPAITGSDRGELLQHIASQQPPAIRRLVPATPLELQTIVHKAMEKNPEHRYASAREMGDDLQRFLDDRPIIATPPRLREKLSKWARRHPGPIATAALILLLLAVGLSVSTFMVSRERERADAALISEREQRQRADANLKLARETIHDAFMQAAKELQDEPQMTERQREFFEKVVAFYEDLPKVETGDPQIRVEAAIAFERLARALATLGDFPQASTNFSHAILLYRDLVDEKLEDTDVFGALVNTLIAAGDIEKDLSQLTRAKEYYAEAQDLLSQDELPPAASRSPYFVQEHLATIEHRLANIAGRFGDVATARNHFREAIRIKSMLMLEAPNDLNNLHEVALAELDFALFLLNASPGHEAKDWLESVERKAQQLKQGENNSTRSRLLLTRAKNGLGVYYRQTGNLPDAHRAIDEAIVEQEQLVQAYPQRHWMQVALHQSRVNLATVMAEQGKASQAEHLLRELLDEAVALCGQHPDSPAFQRELALTYTNLSHVLKLQQKKDERREFTSKALNLWKALAKTNPSEPDMQAELSRAFYNFADTLSAVEALPILETAASELEPLVEQYPTIPSYRDRLTNLLVKQAEAHTALQQYDQALNCYRRQQEHTKRLTERWPDSPAYRLKLAKQNLLLGKLHLKMKQWGKASACFQASVEQRNEFVKRFPTHPESLDPRPLARLFVAQSLAVDAERSGMNSPRLPTDTPSPRTQAIHAAAKIAVDRDCVGWVITTEEFQQLDLRERETYYERVDDLLAARSIAANDVWQAKRLATMAIRVSWLIDQQHWSHAERVLAGMQPVAYDLADRFPSLANAFVWLQVGRWPEPTRWLSDGDVEEEGSTLQIARRVVESAPNAKGNWNSLGCVLLWRGQLESAREALERSIKLRDGGNAFDWVLLALCLAKQGEVEQARSWQAKLLNEAGETIEQDVDLQRFNKLVEAELERLQRQ